MRRILILDDDVWTVKLLTHFLSSHEYEISGTTDSEEAIEIIQRVVPDIIISDILMPKMDGFSILETVRANTLTSHIPLLFISSLSDEHHLRKAMNMGVDDYLVKPIKKELLLESVEARFTRKIQYEYQFQLALERLRYNLTNVLPHELRTPLSGIIGTTSLLESSLHELTKEEIADLVYSMKQSTVRLSKVVEETLLYSQIELILQDPEASDRERKRTSPIVLDAIADIVVTAAEYRNRLSDITFLNHEQRQIVYISISETYFQSLIEQLIDNACMYSPHGSPILCEISKRNGNLMIMIQDEGRGLSDEQIKEVDAFVQFEREYYEQQGIGIGLALVKKIIQLAKGSLKIESIIGIGTKVTVCLPLILHEKKDV